MTERNFSLFNLATFFIFILIFTIISAYNSNFFPTNTPDLEKHGEDLLQKAQSSDLPSFLHKQYGTKGINYDLDENGKPFIWCETYNKAQCTSDNITECMKPIKCTTERKTHQLGCMAVFVYNATKEVNNFTDILQEPALKGCWSQEAEELRECHAHDQCVVDLRGTGNKDRSAQFCCCRTHNCNKVVSFQNKNIPNTNGFDSEEKLNGTEGDINDENDYGYMYIIFIVIIVIVITTLSIYYIIDMLKKKKRVRREHAIDGGITPVASPNSIPMRRLEYNAQCMAVINGKLIDLRNVELKEKISKGRFGEVYRGEIEGAYLAVKLCGRAELDSWVNEQDIYTIRPMRKHPNIAEFVASFEFNSRYWLVTQYYVLGSLFDYLQNYTVSLVECAKIIAGFLNGLAFLHEDIVHPYPKPTIIHRDFKSKNVLMKDNLTSCISDFGLAMKYNGGAIADELHGQVGTRRYMAPEVLEGATEFTSFAFQQIDVYAAALVMWEVLNRTEIPSFADVEPSGIPPAKLPYESEIGLSPTLGPLRELVVLKKMRPKIRECLSKEPLAEKLITTMTEMWEMEPDARITSGCARDRVFRVYFDISGVPYNTGVDINDSVPDIPVIPVAKNVIHSVDTNDKEEYVINIDGDAETAFLEKNIQSSD